LCQYSTWFIFIRVCLTNIICIIEMTVTSLYCKIYIYSNCDCLTLCLNDYLLLANYLFMNEHVLKLLLMYIQLTLRKITIWMWKKSQKWPFFYVKFLAIFHIQMAIFRRVRYPAYWVTSLCKWNKEWGGTF